MDEEALRCHVEQHCWQPDLRNGIIGRKREFLWRRGLAFSHGSCTEWQGGQSRGAGSVHTPIADEVHVVRQTIFPHVKHHARGTDTAGPSGFPVKIVFTSPLPVRSTESQRDALLACVGCQDSFPVERG